MPFMRAHSTIATGHQMETNYFAREPWLQSARVQAVIRNCIWMRYSLSHYLYTAFWQASVMGSPIVRPMFWDFYGAVETYAITS